MGGGPGLDRARRVTLRCVEICLLQASSARGWLTRVRTLACDGLSKTTRLLGEKIRPTTSHAVYIQNSRRRKEEGLVVSRRRGEGAEGVESEGEG